MKNLEEIKRILIGQKEELRRTYNVRDIGIFGSYVHGMQKKKSDIDILVEFEEPVGFFKFLELEEYLGDILGIKVDLVSRKALKPYIGKNILKEAVML
jgi:predicted nucleotidyltransferase